MITTLSEFITKLKEIKERGWIKTHRQGSTGVGKTLEDLLGIPENNSTNPDFGDYELKSCRINSNSMLTMFTKSPQPYRSNTYLRQKYGYSSSTYSNDEKVLHSTLTAKDFTPISNTGHHLKIACDRCRISIESKTEVENVFWDRESLRNAFEKKYKNKFIYVRAQSRGSGVNEEFYYVEAYEVSGFDYDSFIDLLEQGKIYVDLRIGQYPNGRTHDHGTGFRIRVNDHHLLFRNTTKII